MQIINKYAKHDWNYCKNPINYWKLQGNVGSLPLISFSTCLPFSVFAPVFVTSCIILPFVVNAPNNFCATIVSVLGNAVWKSLHLVIVTHLILSHSHGHSHIQTPQIDWILLGSEAQVPAALVRPLQTRAANDSSVYTITEKAAPLLNVLNVKAHSTRRGPFHDCTTFYRWIICSSTPYSMIVQLSRWIVCSSTADIILRATLIQWPQGTWGHLYTFNFIVLTQVLSEILVQYSFGVHVKKFKYT